MFLKTFKNFFTDLFIFQEQDFNAVPFRGLAREIIVNDILKPTLDLVSDPDFINQTLVWLYQDYKIKNDIFLTSIRCSENMEELIATREMVQKEISFIRSNDSKAEGDSTLKVGILYFNFSLNPLRFSLTRESYAKMTKAKSWAICKTSIIEQYIDQMANFVKIAKCIPNGYVCYSCNNITTTIIQISRLFYFGFFSKTNHQMMI